MAQDYSVMGGHGKAKLTSSGALRLGPTTIVERRTSGETGSGDRIPRRRLPKVAARQGRSAFKDTTMSTQEM